MEENEVIFLKQAFYKQGGAAAIEIPESFAARWRMRRDVFIDTSFDVSPPGIDPPLPPIIHGDLFVYDPDVAEVLIGLHVIGDSDPITSLILRYTLKGDRHKKTTFSQVVFCYWTSAEMRTIEGIDKGESPLFNIPFVIHQPDLIANHVATVDDVP